MNKNEKYTQWFNDSPCWTKTTQNLKQRNASKLKKSGVKETRKFKTNVMHAKKSKRNLSIKKSNTNQTSQENLTELFLN